MIGLSFLLLKKIVKKSSENIKMKNMKKFQNVSRI
jgi:hypothetical protein